MSKHNFKLVKTFNLNDIPQDIVKDVIESNVELYSDIVKTISHIKVSRDDNKIASLYNWLMEHGALDKEVVCIIPY